MDKTTQISAPISRETKEMLDRQVKATGVKKGYLIESALRYHLRALQELPVDVLVPARIVLTQQSFEQVADRLGSPGEPSRKLRDLLRDGD